MADQRKQELTRRLMEVSDQLAEHQKHASVLRVEFQTLQKQIADITQQEQERKSRDQHEQTYLGL